MIADYRSDTVTRPTPAMCEAMMSAPLGDDVFGDDPSVNLLQQLIADLFGFESALFCASGTMANQIAIAAHTRPGDEVICDRLSHIYNYEGGGIARNAGCSVRLLEGDRGRFTAEQVRDNVNPNDPHYARTTLVSIENTCNKGGGAIWDSSEIQRIRQECQRLGLKLHLDGARIFNALVKTGEGPATLGTQFDSISVCLSKGLGCPVGSVLLGNEVWIAECRRIRKVMGGGMRQAGMLAAAGIYALDHHIERLRHDHEHANLLAECLRELPWVKTVMPCETNIVVAELILPEDQQSRIRELETKGIRTVAFGPGKVRFVTHLDVTQNHLDCTVEQLRKTK